MEVVAASNFLSEFVNAIVNACIVYNIMVTAVCTRIAVCKTRSRKIIRIAIRRKMNNYYTVMIYLTSQIKNASNYFNRLNLFLLFKAVG